MLREYGGFNGIARLPAQTAQPDGCPDAVETGRNAESAGRSPGRPRTGYEMQS